MTPWLVRSVRILVLAALLAGTACTRGPTPVTTLVPGGTVRLGLRYLALGDSYTVGEGVDGEETWPSQLVTQLRARGVAIGDPEVVARTGWTTEELAAELDRAAPVGRYALVTLLVGVNDQYRGRDTSAYRAAFAPLVSRAIGWAGGEPKRVIVVSIPDWGVTPHAADRDRAAISRAIDAFNGINRDEARRAGVRYVDVTESSRRAATYVRLLAADGLHPSGAMYADWVGLALGDALEAVAGRRP
jgi:lysophospholipase L1-like esterase